MATRVLVKTDKEETLVWGIFLGLERRSEKRVFIVYGKRDFGAAKQGTRGNSAIEGGVGLGIES